MPSSKSSGVCPQLKCHLRPSLTLLAGMRIKLEQLPQHLQKQTASLYTLFGNEPLLILEAADLIRTHARQQGYT